VQPGSPVGSASSSRGQRGDSSSSEQAAPANSLQHSRGLPLLAQERDNTLKNKNIHHRPLAYDVADKRKTEQVRRQGEVSCAAGLLCHYK